MYSRSIKLPHYGSSNERTQIYENSECDYIGNCISLFSFRLFGISAQQLAGRINGFNANKQNRQATDVVATVTIDFSNQQDLWESFKKKYNVENHPEWTFSENYTATLRW